MKLQRTFIEVFFIIYYSLIDFLGSLVKIFFIGSFSGGKNLKLFLGGGMIGHKAQIFIGDDVQIHGWIISEGGKIFIGDRTKVNKDAIIRSKARIDIGKYCDIGSDVYIQDHNSLSLNYMDRRSHQGEVICKPIRIGDDVWIGRRAIILKGVTIGDRAVIGAGAIVTHDVPSDSVAAGNPAKIVKYFQNKAK